MHHVFEEMIEAKKKKSFELDATCHEYKLSKYLDYYVYKLERELWVGEKIVKKVNWNGEHNK